MLEAEGTGPGCEIVSSSRSGQRGRERRICGRHRAEEPGMSWKHAGLLEEVKGKCPRLRRVAGVGRVGRRASRRVRGVGVAWHEMSMGAR